jgi:hypothetical protein
MQRILAIVVMAGSLGFLAGCGESAAEKTAREAKEAAEKQAMIKSNDEDQKKFNEENEKSRAESAGKGEEASDEGKKTDENATDEGPRERRPLSTPHRGFRSLRPAAARSTPRIPRPQRECISMGV